MLKTILICGPAGSGKSEFVRLQMSRGDIVIDIDKLYQAISYLDPHDKPREIIEYVRAAKEAIYKLAEKDKSDRWLWIVTSGAEVKTRDRFRKRFKADVYVFETPIEECVARIKEDKTRYMKTEAEWYEIIGKWWQRYEKDMRDKVMGEGGSNL